MLEVFKTQLLCNPLLLPGLLVAAMIKTCWRVSRPSISVRSWFTTRTLAPVWKEVNISPSTTNQKKKKHQFLKYKLNYWASEGSMPGFQQQTCLWSPAIRMVPIWSTTRNNSLSVESGVRSYPWALLSVLKNKNKTKTCPFKWKLLSKERADFFWITKCRCYAKDIFQQYVSSINRLLTTIYMRKQK